MPPTQKWRHDAQTTHRGCLPPLSVTLSVTRAAGVEEGEEEDGPAEFESGGRHDDQKPIWREERGDVIYCNVLYCTVM